VVPISTHIHRITHQSTVKIKEPVVIFNFLMPFAVAVNYDAAIYQ